MGARKKYIEMFGSFAEPFNYFFYFLAGWLTFQLDVGNGVQTVQTPIHVQRQSSPATQHHCTLAGTKLHCSVTTVTYLCMNNVQGRYMITDLPYGECT